MAEIKEIAYRDWGHFKQEVFHDLAGKNKGDLSFGRYLFRGQGSQNWRLETSFDRRCNDGSKEERRSLEKSLIDALRRELKPEEISIDDESNHEMLLALAQHHGLPTRLLDWTESVYVAVFFCVLR